MSEAALDLAKKLLTNEMIAFIEEKIAHAVAQEREECAKIADEMQGAGQPGSRPGLLKYSPIAAAIRLRST